MFATWKQHEGQAVDGIALLRLLGSGESSAVFEAELAGERCSIKLVPTEDVVAQVPLSRWEQASKLSHPHLSRILKWGRAQLDGISLVYAAMEYAEEELASVDRPLTPREAREMLNPAAKALGYIHGKGFAHGRIQPSNVLSVRDVLKVSGDAPLKLGERHASSPGPRPYDPPEIATSGVTPAGDVWSLGVSLVWAMTKELPTLDGGVVRLPDSLRPDIFRVVAAGCLERDPARRWTVANISQWLERETLPSSKRVRPRYFWPAAAAGVIALGTVAWIYGGPYLTSAQPSNRPAQAAATPSPQPPPQPPAASTAPAPDPVEAPARPAATRPPADAKPAARVKPEPHDAADASPVVAANDVTSPDVLQPVVPDVTAKARATIHGKVPIVVRVEADASGTVTSAKIESGASSKYFANLSLKAVHQWKFVPGADAREWLVRFEYIRDADHPVSARVTPAH
jgi:hypothetical protein